MLALGFAEVDDLAFPAGLRVEPPTARPADLGATDDDAQVFQSLDGAVNVLRLQSDSFGDFDLRDLNDILEIQPSVQLQEDAQDFAGDILPGGKLLEKLLVDLHPRTPVRAFYLSTAENWNDSLMQLTSIINVSYQLGVLHARP